MTPFGRSSLHLVIRAWWIALIAAVALAWPAAAQSKVSHEVLTLLTADGVQLPAVLTYPASGFNPNAPVIVHIPDGPGGSPITADSPARFVAEALATEGFGNLSLETRLSTSYAFSRFDEAVTDIKAAIDALAGRGVGRIVLAGHGLGSLQAARYLVETGDPRVRGLIHYAPSRDLADAWRAEVGDEIYWKTVDNASRAVNEGDRTFVNLGDGLIFTPPTFLDWYGPTAKTSLAANLPGIDQPMLLAAGANDPTVPPDRLAALKAVSLLSEAVTIKSYPGAGHDLTPAAAQLAADTTAWLNGLGLETVSDIETEFIDVTAEDGVTLSGLLYRPALESDPARPAFILIHGWTSDVMRSTAHWLAVRLAQRGYVALSIRHRGSGFKGAVAGKLEDTPKDIRPWFDLMTARGYRALVGVGHSAGNLWLSYYLAQTKDPRIRALIYLAPQRDLPKHARTAMGEDLYARTVLAAQEAVRDGEGAKRLIDAPFPRAIYDDDARQPMFISAPQSGFTYYYADAFLSYWGPASKAVHTDLIKGADRPLLALGGSRDPFMQGAYLIQFTESAGEKAEYIFYGGPDGAPHSFEGFERRVTDDILAWLGKAL